MLLTYEKTGIYPIFIYRIFRYIGMIIFISILMSTNPVLAASNRMGRLNVLTGQDVKIEQILAQSEYNKLINSGELKIHSEHRWGRSRRILYQQYFDDVPVIGSRVVVKYSNSGLVRTLYSTVVEWQSEHDLIFSYDSLSAMDIAINLIKPDIFFNFPIAERAVLPRNGAPVPVWRVVLPVRSPIGEWEVIIDASTGEILLYEDRLARMSGLGWVFDPDPKSALRTDTLRDEGDSDEAVPSEAYSEVLLSDLERDNENNYILSNQFVDATPSPQPARIDSGEFLFLRSDIRFEQVMGFFHIDRQARYVINLGFEDLPPRPQRIVANGIEDDISFFSPLTGLITTGRGGVDDGEDADVWIHEYTHSLLENILPRWRGGDSPMLAEGLCDYFAGDASLSIVQDFQPDWVYNWDGHNEFWDGRVLNSDYRYPQDAHRERHDAGQLWSSLLYSIRRNTELRDEWNLVVLDHLYALGDSITAPQAAQALLEADLFLTYGRFRRQIITECERRGIQPLGWQRPVIVHQPLGDTEDIHAERQINARIISPVPIDSSSVSLVFSFNNNDFDTLYLYFNEIDGIWQTLIPSPNDVTWVYYYLFVRDTFNVSAYHPFDAPNHFHRYFVGPDRIPPHFVSVDSLPDTPFPDGEMLVGAYVIDNIGVSDVWVYCYNRFMEQCGYARLRPQIDDNSLFIGRLRWSAAMDQTLRYCFIATDVARAHNIIQTGFRTFNIRQEATIDGFEFGTRRWYLDGWFRDTTCAKSGRVSLRDRLGENFASPRQTTAMLDEDWCLAGFGAAQLTFWEKHSFDLESGEYGCMEITLNNGQNWIELRRFEGKQDWWEHIVISLNEFSYFNSPPVRLRWRSITPQEAEERSGWFIDDLHLAVGNIVKTDESCENLKETHLFLYPNPTNGRLSINLIKDNANYDNIFLSNMDLSLIICDINGRILRKFEYNKLENSSSVDISTLPAGLYIVQMKFGEKVYKQKIILLK